MGRDCETIRACIEQLFDTSLKNSRRNELAKLLPSLKLVEGWASLDKVINRLGTFCDGWAYALGDTFPSLSDDYSSLSEKNRETLNRFYLQEIEHFEASLRQA